MLEIKITYTPIPQRRRAHTHAIAAALATLKGTPADSAGNPASFLLPAKHSSALRVAAKDAKILITTHTEPDGIRVWLKGKAIDNTAPLPL